MPFSKPDMMAGMDALMGDPMMGAPPPMPPGGGLEGAGFLDGAGTGAPILCRVCEVLIDSATGDPLSPVGPEAVDSVRQYVSEAGAAKKGGIPLIDNPALGGDPGVDVGADPFAGMF
jgi:hypothetical protein